MDTRGSDEDGRFRKTKGVLAESLRREVLTKTRNSDKCEVLQENEGEFGGHGMGEVVVVVKTVS